MADIEVKKINQLPLAGILDLSNDILALEQGGIAKKIPIATLRQNNAGALDTGTLSMDRIASEAITDVKIADLAATKLTGTIADARLPSTAARQSRSAVTACEAAGWYYFAQFSFRDAIIAKVRFTTPLTGMVIVSASGEVDAASTFTQMSATGAVTDGPSHIGSFNTSNDSQLLGVFFPTAKAGRTFQSIVESNDLSTQGIALVGASGTVLEDWNNNRPIRYNLGIIGDIYTIVAPNTTYTLPSNLKIGESVSVRTSNGAGCTITAPLGVYHIVGAFNAVRSTGETFTITINQCFTATRQA